MPENHWTLEIPKMGEMLRMREKACLRYRCTDIYIAVLYSSCFFSVFVYVQRSGTYRYPLSTSREC